MPKKTSSYTGEQIVVLEGLEPVRKRPAMYIGSTSLTGVHHCLNEIIDNSIDEALAGFANNVWVTIHKDESVTVIDDGRGIPVDKVPKYNTSALELVMTKLHAGGKFEGKAYKISGGLHGVGASVVNALSSEMTVEDTETVVLTRNHTNGAKRFLRSRKSGKQTIPGRRSLFFRTQIYLKKASRLPLKSSKNRSATGPISLPGLRSI